MLLAIDVGNTNTKFGMFDKDGVLLFSSRVVTDSNRTEDQYAIELRDILRLYRCNEKDISGFAISSVSPPMTQLLTNAIVKHFGKYPLVVGPGIKTGLHIAIDNPAQLGSDMVVTSIAAIAIYTKPIVVINMGTATTISFINSEGIYMGCAIAPGVVTSLSALSSKTAQLPLISVEEPFRVIGTNTIDSMRSGVIFGTAGMLDSMIDRIEREYGKVATVVATGGMSGEIIPHCTKNIVLDPDLLMNGLYLLYKKNRV